MPKCYKIVFLGSKKVGKTAIIEQLVHGHHNIGSVSEIIPMFWFIFRLLPWLEIGSMCEPQTARSCLALPFCAVKISILYAG